MVFFSIHANKFTLSDISSLSCTRRAKNEFGSRDNVVLVVRKQVPPTLRRTHWLLPCFVSKGLFRGFKLTVVILFVLFHTLDLRVHLHPQPTHTHTKSQWITVFENSNFNAHRKIQFKLEFPYGWCQEEQICYSLLICVSALFGYAGSFNSTKCSEMWTDSRIYRT